VKGLPEKCRIVFQLSREKGYSQKQIAAELGIAEKTVEAHLSAALRRLRTGLSHLFTFLFLL
jgi:RNA polymerase sigma-70 factor (ECF subfamily)